MKFFFFIFVLLPVLLFSQLNLKKPKVLFIGNSYTYVNNLPQLIHDVAIAAGDTLIFDSSCPGGYTFLNHSLDQATIAKINWGHWDYVVLQAQSQEPSFSPAQVNAQTLPYAIVLDTMIKNHNACATTVFYETWGRKLGDASNCASYPPVCTYTGMQNRLKQSYKAFADTCHGLFSPVGEAFRKSIALNPALELYQSDQSHPSLEGSYLAACVFYEMLYQKSVLSNTFNPGIGTATLSFLQQTAHAVVQDSLVVWNVGKFIPKAAYTYSLLSNANVQFNAMFPWLNHTWYFGDGTANLGPQLQHQYSSGGIKTVSHVVDDGCKRDSIVMQMNLGNISTALKEDLNQANIQMYPNPVSSYFKITDMNGHVISGCEVELINLLGQKFILTEEEGLFKTNQFANGLYQLIVKHKNKLFQIKLIINQND